MISKSLQFCWSSLMRSLETSDFRLEISCDGRSRFSAVCCFRSWGHYPVSKKESTHPPTTRRERARNSEIRGVQDTTVVCSETGRWVSVDIWQSTKTDKIQMRIQIQIQIQ